MLAALPGTNASREAKARRLRKDHDVGDGALAGPVPSGQQGQLPEIRRPLSVLNLCST
jgi:hypothetical protein